MSKYKRDHKAAEVRLRKLSSRQSEVQTRAEKSQKALEEARVAFAQQIADGSNHIDELSERLAREQGSAGIYEGALTELANQIATQRGRVEEARQEMLAEEARGLKEKMLDDSVKLIAQLAGFQKPIHVNFERASRLRHIRVAENVRKNTAGMSVDWNSVANMLAQAQSIIEA